MAMWASEDSGLSAGVLCSRHTVLEKLRENRAKHAEIVKEAREGYIKAATQAVMDRLQALRTGKFVDLVFRLQLPEDHTPDYDTAIAMLELHQADTIQMTGSEVQRFVLDRWEWRGEFLHANAAYSVAAAAELTK